MVKQRNFSPFFSQRPDYAFLAASFPLNLHHLVPAILTVGSIIPFSNICWMSYSVSTFWGGNLKMVQKQHLCCSPYSASLSPPSYLFPFLLTAQMFQDPKSVLGIFNFRYRSLHCKQLCSSYAISDSLVFWCTPPKITFLLTITKLKSRHNKMTPCNCVSQVKENLVDMKSDSVKFSPRGIWHYYIPHQSRYCFSNNCITCNIQILPCHPTNSAKTPDAIISNSGPTKIWTLPGDFRVLICFQQLCPNSMILPWNVMEFDLNIYVWPNMYIYEETMHLTYG